MKEPGFPNKTPYWLGLAFCCVFLAMLTMLAGKATASIPQRVKVNLSQGTDPNTTKITLQWKGWEAGDTLKRSVNGSAWTTLSPGAGGFSINGDEATYVEDNFPDWQMVYFLLTSGGNTKRINVYPPIENGHSNYSDDTNQCRLCHITHTAQSKRLLNQASIKELCYTCHGGAGTGSRYNVEKGTVLSADAVYRRSQAGPFAGNAPAWNNLPATSFHDIFNENQTLLAPGGGGNMTLSCLSCHNAHDNGNQNYRLLNTAHTPVTVDAYAYYDSTASAVYNFQEGVNYLNNGLNQFCASCHPDYQRGSGSGSSTMDSVYRHATDVPLTWNNTTLTTTLPTFTEGVGGERKIFCGTCHYAHGTVVVGTNPKSEGPETTVLKRRDNMGICEDCHQK